MKRAVLILCVSGLIFGCALSHDKFYDTDGTLCADLKSFVLGTGDAAKYVIDEDCNVTLRYNTKDTGISERAGELGGKIAEGLTKGAAKGINPIP